MRLGVFVLFWVGIFMAVREWRVARKQGVPIPRAEKLYPAIVFLLVVAVASVPGWIPSEVSPIVIALSLGVILNVWAIQRRIRRS